MKLLQVLVIGIFVLNPRIAMAMSCPESLLPDSSTSPSAFTTFVLDTNVLLEKPSAFLEYGNGQTVAITEQTLRELDSKKTDPRLGWAAREFFRLFKASTGDGSLSRRISLENGSTLELLTVGPIGSRSPWPFASLISIQDRILTTASSRQSCNTSTQIRRKRSFS